MKELIPINSVSIDLEKGFEDWNRDITNFFANLWGFFISVRISMEQSQIILVDQIQGVYRSQSVQISNKHVEIIVSQMTSKVLTLENGMANGFVRFTDDFSIKAIGLRALVDSKNITTHKVQFFK